MKEAYFLHITGKQEGPFSLEELRDNWRKRHALGITRETPYWQKGLSEWLPLSEIEDTLEPLRAASNLRQPQATPKAKKQTNLLVTALIAAAIVTVGIYFFFLRKGELEGEVFIVTKGGQNYKLGLVTVSLLSLDDLKRGKAEAAAEIEKLEHLREFVIAEREAGRGIADLIEEIGADSYISFLEKIDSIESEKYFSHLPNPIYTTQTNSDGKFSLPLPIRGDFALSATSSRNVGNSTERYYWLLKVSMEGANKKRIMLSNNNLSTAGAAESLFSQTDISNRKR